MSLKSSRKRLKEYDDLQKNQTNSNKKFDSLLSKFAQNPKTVVDIDKDKNDLLKNKLQNKKSSSVQNFIDKSKYDKAKKEAYQIHIDKNSKSLKDRISFSKDKENINLEEQEYSKKHKKSSILLISMIVVELLTLIAIFGFGFLVRMSNMTQEVKFDKEQVRSEEIDVNTLNTMKGYRTIAIFGLDSRTGSVSKGNNADVNIIANINLETGEVQLVSIFRDLYINITDDNHYGKINGAYLNGGPEKSVKAINKNFDLDITNYVSFNWKAVADGINMLGGIDLEINRSEFKYINSFIHETCIATGINGDNPAQNYLLSSGYQHLNGIQAVAYARLRLMDSDFQRVERQKKVIALCLEKAKTLDVANIMGIAISIIPTLAYDFDWAELTSLIKSIDGIKIVYSSSFPSNDNIKIMNMGASGDCVVPNTLEKAVPELHKILYNDDEYVPSSAVKRYSARINELKIKYEEENRLAAEKLAEEKEMEENIKNGIYIATRSSTTRRIYRSSSSNVKARVVDSAPYSIKDKDGPILPIINGEEDEEYYEVYEEEPEEDEISAPISRERRMDVDDRVIISPSNDKDIKSSNGIAPSSSTNNNGPGSPMIDGPPGTQMGNNNAPMSSNKNNDVSVVDAPFPNDRQQNSETRSVVPPANSEAMNSRNIIPTAPSNSVRNEVNSPMSQNNSSIYENMIEGPPVR